MKTIYICLLGIFLAQPVFAAKKDRMIEIKIVPSEETYIKVNDEIIKAPATVRVPRDAKTFKVIGKDGFMHEVKFTRRFGKPRSTFIDLDDLDTFKLERNGVLDKSIVRKKPLVFGRIEIYQIGKDQKVKEISSYCSFQASGIKNSNILDDDNVISMDESGLIVFVPMKKTKRLVIDKIHCNYADFVYNFQLVIDNIDQKSNTYFGDVNIFIMDKPDHKEGIKCKGIKCPRKVNDNNYFYPKKITISDNEEKTSTDIYKYYGLIKNKLQTVKNFMFEVKNDQKQDIKETNKQLPF